MEDHEMVQALAANRTDESLDIGVLPWAAGRSENFVNAHPFGGLLKLVLIAGVAVTEQIGRCCGSRKLRPTSKSPRYGRLTMSQAAHSPVGPRIQLWIVRKR